MYQEVNGLHLLTLTPKSQSVISISSRSPLARHSAYRPQSTLQLVLVYAVAVVRYSNGPSTGIDPAVDERCFCVNGVVNELGEDGGIGRERDGGLYELRDTRGELRDGAHGGSRNQWQEHTANCVTAGVISRYSLNISDIHATISSEVNYVIPPSRRGGRYE